MNLLHERKALGLLVITGSVLALTVGLNASSTDYEKFEVLPNNTEVVYEECTCYGSLAVRESYPPQYDCQGYQMCRPTNFTRPGN